LFLSDFKLSRPFFGFPYSYYKSRIIISLYFFGKIPYLWEVPKNKEAMDTFKTLRGIIGAASILYRVERRPVITLAIAALAGIPVMPIELLLVRSLVDQVQQWQPALSIAPIVLTAAWLSVLMVIGNIVLGVPVPMAMTRLNEIGDHEQARLLLQTHSDMPLAEIESPAVKDSLDRAAKASIYEMYDTGVRLLQTALQAATLISLMLMYGQWIPVAAVVAAVYLYFTISGKSAEQLERTSGNQAGARRLLKHYAELIAGRDAAKELRLFDLYPLLSGRWSTLYSKQSRETVKAVQHSEARKLGPELAMGLLTGIMIALLVASPDAERLSAGDFSLLFLALTMLLALLTGLANQGVSIRTLQVRWEDFQSFVKMGPIMSAASDSDAKPSAKPAISLSVKKVSFHYPGAAQPALREISFAIPPGCRAALVGPNGSGKTTLVKVLAGLYSPQEGEIVWQNGDGGKLRESTNDQMSAVFQDFTRLALTLRENVAIGSLSQRADDRKLRETLQSAAYPQANLDAQLGAIFGGIEPSGGEWQKIATARALFKDAGFVFFDEPTAALDRPFSTGDRGPIGTAGYPSVGRGAAGGRYLRHGKWPHCRTRNPRSIDASGRRLSANV
jgi:ABC-type bacteriocin/lantibiotic exporter with double-glycine peptidase domain